MRILFVKGRLPRASPQAGIEHSVLEPLEFEYLAAAVPHHEVRLLDLRRESSGVLEKTLETFRPHVVGATATTVDVGTVQAVFDRVRELRPSALTIVGGYHATFRPVDFAGGSTDVIVPGAGERAFRDVVDWFDSGRRGFEGIPGLVLPRDGGILRTAERPLPSLDSFAPERSISARYRRTYHSQLWMPCALVRNTLGCCYRCSFCALWKLGKGEILERDVYKLCDEIEGLREKYVLFTDDLSFSPSGIPRMERFCDEVVRRGLRKEFYFSSRADVIVDHPHIVERLCAAGMTRMFLGLESWNDSEIASWNKHIPTSVNSEAVRLLHARGVDVTASFVITPDYTREQFEALFQYVDSLRLFCPSFLVFTPNPGTQAHDERGYRRLTDDYELYDHLHTLFETRLPLDEFYHHFSELWRRAYSPFRRTGYRRFFNLLRHMSPPLAPHLFRMTLATFRRMADGHLVQGN